MTRSLTIIKKFEKTQLEIQRKILTYPINFPYRKLGSKKSKQEILAQRDETVSYFLVTFQLFHACKYFNPV